MPQGARLFNFGDSLDKIRLPFPVLIFRFSAKFNQDSENHELCNFGYFEAQTRVCVTLEVFLRLNTARLASDNHPELSRTMNFPVLKSQHLERRFRGYGVGQNLILPVGLGLLAAVAMFFAPAARAANTTNATTSILVVEPGDNRPAFSDYMSRLRQALTTNLSSHVVVYR